MVLIVFWSALTFKFKMAVQNGRQAILKTKTVAYLDTDGTKSQIKCHLLLSLTSKMLQNDF